MAGLYVIIGNSESPRIRAAVQRLKFFDDEQIETISEPGLAVGWISSNDFYLFGPALDLQTGVRVISAGRVAWDESQWQQAASLHQYQGGLSNRLLLQQYLEGGVEAIERHNASAVLLVWDPRQQQVHLLTDHFGYYPIFIYRPEQVDGCVIASSADAIADDLAVQVTPDYVSMAEFLWQCKATPPHTYYQEIKYAGAATHSFWDLGQQTWRCREYWQPFQEEFFSSLPAAVEALTAAVRRSVHIRTLPRLGPIASYTSGGLDSRVILFAAADPGQLLGVNLYDSPNLEAITAQQLCELAGAKYIGFERDSDYYPQWLDLAAKYGGSMWSAQDSHFLGTREFVCGKLAARTVLSACSTDFLFKDANLDRTQAHFFGQRLPWLTFPAQWNGGFLDPPVSQDPLPSKFEAEMRHRLHSWFGEVPTFLQNDLERLQVEDKRNRPMCYAAGLAFQLMFNTFPYDVFMADRAIADCYSRTPAHWKLNARLWGLVVTEICGSTIADTTSGRRPNASPVDRLLHSARNRLRQKLRLIPPPSTPQGLATEGSWPNLGWYIQHSSTLQQLWETTLPSDRQLVTELWGSDPWQVPLGQWAKSRAGQRHFFQLATFLSYLTTRRKTVLVR